MSASAMIHKISCSSGQVHECNVAYIKVEWNEKLGPASRGAIRCPRFVTGTTIEGYAPEAIRDLQDESPPLDVTALKCNGCGSTDP